MAKIKTIKQTVNGMNYEIVIKCNSKGRFSCDIPLPLRSIISDLQEIQRTEYQSMQNLESMIIDKIAKHRESMIKTELVIAVSFKARGRIVRNENDITLPQFSQTGKFRMDSTFFYEKGDVIYYDYNVLLKETINGNAEYYRTSKLCCDRFTEHVPEYRKINGYIAENRIYSIKDYACILPYDETILTNLDAIRNQFKKAVLFLSDLLDNEKAAVFLLTDRNVNLLDDNHEQKEA